MSKYKVGFYANSNANAFCTNAEVIDLVDDYGYTEKEAEKIINDEKKLEEEFDTWLWNTIKGWINDKTRRNLQNQNRK